MFLATIAGTTVTVHPRLFNYTTGRLRVKQCRPVEKEGHHGHGETNGHCFEQQSGLA
jgi:hypothetical protein